MQPPTCSSYWLLGSLITMKGHLILTTASLQTRTGSGRARVQQADSYRFFRLRLLLFYLPYHTRYEK